MFPVFSQDRLGGADAAWLHMDEPTNPMVVNCLLELGGPLDGKRFRAVVQHLVAVAPHFRARVVDGPLSLGVPHWEPDPTFELDRHLEHVRLEPGEPALRAFIGRQLGHSFDRSRPLWHFFVLEREGANPMVLCRIHHALADGFALLGLLLSLCDEHQPAPPGNQTHGWKSGSLARHALALGRLVTLPADPSTSLKRPLSTDKRVGWSQPLPLSQVKTVARALGATVNDVLVSLVAGALRRHLVEHHEPVEEVRAIVPVNLRSGASTALGNRFGLVILALPVGVADPLARVRETSRRMAKLKGSPEAVVALAVLEVLGWSPQRLESLGVSFFGQKASLVLTNVPGPREPLHLAGVPLRRLIFWVPQSARMGLGVSIFSYAGEVTVGVLSDATVLTEPQVVVDALERELALLTAQATRT